VHIEVQKVVPQNKCMNECDKSKGCDPFKPFSFSLEKLTQNETLMIDNSATKS